MRKQCSKFMVVSQTLLILFSYFRHHRQKRFYDTCTLKINRVQMVTRIKQSTVHISFPLCLSFSLLSVRYCFHAASICKRRDSFIRHFIYQLERFKLHRPCILIRATFCFAGPTDSKTDSRHVHHLPVLRSWDHG